MKSNRLCTKVSRASETKQLFLSRRRGGAGRLPVPISRVSITGNTRKTVHVSASHLVRKRVCAPVMVAATPTEGRNGSPSTSGPPPADRKPNLPKPEVPPLLQQRRCATFAPTRETGKKKRGRKSFVGGLVAKLRPQTR